MRQEQRDEQNQITKEDNNDKKNYSNDDNLVSERKPEDNRKNRGEFDPGLG